MTQSVSEQSESPWMFERGDILRQSTPPQTAKWRVDFHQEMGGVRYYGLQRIDSTGDTLPGLVLWPATRVETGEYTTS